MTPPGPADPSWLPPPLSDFVNRIEDQAAVKRFLAQDSLRDVVITGDRRIGKTSFVTMLPLWIGERFPDGPIFADLSGDLVTVMQSVLFRLDVELEAIESEPDALREQYKRVTSGCAHLVIVDNAPSKSAAEFFRPGPGRSAFFVVAREWPQDPTVVRRHLGPLSPEYAAQMLMNDCPGLSRTEADQAVRGEWWSPDRIRAASGYLRTFQEYTAANPPRLLTLADANTGEMYAATRSMLSADADWLYGLLFLLEGREFPIEMLYALHPETADYFPELERANLVEPVDSDRRRFRLNGEAPAGGMAPRHASAMHDLLRRMLSRAQRADRTITPERLRIGRDDSANAPAFTTERPEREALRWLRDHRAILVGLVRTATVSGWSTEAWTLAEALWPMFNSLPFHMQAIDCYRTALDAAAGDRLATARIQIFLGRKLIDTRAFEESEAMLYEAVRSVMDLKRDDLVVAAKEQIVWLHLEEGQHGKAAAVGVDALRLAESLGRVRSQTLLHKHLGSAYLGLEDTKRARESFARVLELSAGTANKRDRAIAVFEIAALRLAAHKRSALPDADSAVRALRSLGFEMHAAASAERLALFLEGDDREHWLRFALETYGKYGSPKADRILRMLD